MQGKPSISLLHAIRVFLYHYLSWQLWRQLLDISLFSLFIPDGVAAHSSIYIILSLLSLPPVLTFFVFSLSLSLYIYIISSLSFSVIAVPDPGLSPEQYEPWVDELLPSLTEVCQIVPENTSLLATCQNRTKTRCATCIFIIVFNRFF